MYLLATRRKVFKLGERQGQRLKLHLMSVGGTRSGPRERIRNVTEAETER